MGNKVLKQFRRRPSSKINDDTDDHNDEDCVERMSPVHSANWESIYPVHSANYERIPPVHSAKQPSIEIFLANIARHGNGTNVTATRHGNGTNVAAARHGNGTNVTATGHGNGTNVTATGHGNGTNVAATGYDRHSAQNSSEASDRAVVLSELHKPDSLSISVTQISLSTPSSTQISHSGTQSSPSGTHISPTGTHISPSGTHIRPSVTPIISGYTKRAARYMDSWTERSYSHLYRKSDEDIALDICNTFWRPALTFSSYRHGSRLVSFESLWPQRESLRMLLHEAHQATSLRRSVLDITKLALRCAPVRLIQELLAAKIIDLDQVFDNGSTMLHLACIARNADVVTFLCNAGISTQAQDKYGRTAHQVCQDSRIKRLLPTPAYRSSSRHERTCPQTPPPGDPGPVGPTPLTQHDHQAVFQLAQCFKHYDQLQMKLQTSEFDVNRDQNEDGEYLIDVVVRGGLCQLPQLLSLVRDQGADIDQCNANGLTPLMIAASSQGNAVLVDVMLCVLAANPNSPNPRNGCFPLHYAAQNNCVDVANCLIKRGADYNLEDASGHRADDVARRCNADACLEVIVCHRRQRHLELGRVLLMDDLVASELRVTDLYQTNENGETLIMLAATYNRVSNLKILIGREGCPIDAQHGKTGRTALTAACIAGHTLCVHTLLRHDANVTLRDVDGLLALHHAVRADHQDVVETLMEFQRTLVGLHLACKEARSSRMRNLLRGAINRRQTEVITPALFEHSLTGNAEELFCTLEEGDGINPVSGVGNWPVYLAAENGHIDVVRVLYKFGADVARRHPASGNTVLHAVCGRAHLHIIGYLLQLYRILPEMDINALNNEGKSPLQIAAERGSRPVVSLLLEHGASTAILDERGDLISCPQYPGIQVLLDNARQRHIADILAAIGKQAPDKVKARKAAPVPRLRDVFHTKYDHNLRDSGGDTPIMAACRHGNLEAVLFLLESANRSADYGHESTISANHSADNGMNVWGEPESGDRESEADSGMDVMDTATKTWFASTGHLLDDEPTELPHVEYRDRSKTFSQITCPDTAGQRKPLYTPSIASGHDVISHVSDINPLDGGAAIHRCIEAGDHVTILMALIGGDPWCVNIQDNLGYSPLHLAGKLARKKITNKLTSLTFVDLNLRTLDGRLVEDMAPNRRLTKLMRESRDQVGRHVAMTTDSSMEDSQTADSQTADSYQTADSQTALSTLLDFDDINERFNKMKTFLFKKGSQKKK